MAIRTITGKPGGGKSYFALREIVEELVFGCRIVVTNLPLKLPELNAYLQEHYPKADIDLHDRVRLLSEDEAKFFFAHREIGVDFVIPSDEETKRGKRVDYGDISKLRPVFYVIDEAHVMFDARAWMTSGPHLTYYNSQHRKPGDEVFFITQFVALLDKRCTGFSQEFVEVRNFGAERLSVFRGPKGQHQARYTLTPPNGSSVTAVHTALFRLDKKLAACYDTTSGVGISGRAGAPREKQIKGLNPVYGLIAAAAAIAFIWWLPNAVAGVVTGMSEKTAKMGQAGISALAPNAGKVAPQLPAAMSGQTGFVDGEPMMVPQPVEPVPLYVDGYAVSPAGPVVWLTDGSRIGAGDVRAIYGNAVELVDGRKVLFRPRRTADGNRRAGSLESAN